MSGKRRRWRIGLALIATGIVAAPVGWTVTDRLERDDAFCISCHLRSGRPLHEAKHEDFHAGGRTTLVAAHGIAGNQHNPDGAFRCIDCHGGVGFVGRARVKLLSAKDAFWYAVRRFEEPETMHWPLLDADCTQCHDAMSARAPAGAPPLFHELPEHGAALGVDCVQCHLAHDSGGLPDHDYLHPAHVRSQCAACHLEYEEGLQ